MTANSTDEKLVDNDLLIKTKKKQNANMIKHLKVLRRKFTILFRLSLKS
jgi:hypothetical protein